MSTNGRSSPATHPHADRPNWRPAETIEQYIANCREGLEDYSDRRAAKIMGLSRKRPEAGRRRGSAKKGVVL